MTCVSIVTPMYNEEETIPTFLYRLKGVEKLLRGDYSVEILLVNDGSRDRTSQLLAEGTRDLPNTKIIHHERNQGFGAALKTGLRQATGDLVVTIDADTNYDHFEIPRILTYMTPEVDLVTASPLMRGSRWHYPAHRFIMSRGVVFLYKQALRGKGDGIATFTSGFRVYRRRILEKIMPEADDFLATGELLIRAILAGCQVREFPTTVYPRNFGRSKLKTARTIRSHLTFIRRIARGELQSCARSAAST